LHAQEKLVALSLDALNHPSLVRGHNAQAPSELVHGLVMQGIHSARIAAQHPVEPAAVDDRDRLLRQTVRMRGACSNTS
jgi:hypothetical protein